MRRIAGWSVCALVLAGLAGACGDGDGDGIGGGDELSRDEYLEQADEICAEGTERTDRLAQAIFGDIEGTNDLTRDQLEEYVEGFTDDVEGQIEDIRALNGPGDLEDEVGAVLDDAADTLEEVRDDPTLLFSDENPFARELEELRDLGLEECGQA